MKVRTLMPAISLLLCRTPFSLIGLILLRSTVLRDTVYQRQQETLIVWSESGSTDLALSFQEAAGCDRIWRQICEVRHNSCVSYLRDFPCAQVQGKDPRLDCTGADEESEDEDTGERSSNVGGALFAGGSPLILPAEKSLPSTGHVILPRVDVSMVGELAEHLTQNVQQTITRKAIGEAMERAECVESASTSMSG